MPTDFEKALLEQEFVFPSDPPVRQRKVTEVSAHARLQFKTIDDQIACGVHILEPGAPGGSAELLIDASGCEHECRLTFRLDALSPYMISANPEAELDMVFMFTAKASGAEGMEPPIRQVTLFEYAPDGVLRVAHKIRKKAPLTQAFAAQTFTSDLPAASGPIGFYEFGVIIAPRASAFVVKSAGARLGRMLNRNAEISQSGARLQGVIPDEAPASVVLRLPDESLEIPVRAQDFTLIAHERHVEFDAPLARLAQPARTDASSGHALLMIDGRLAGFTRIDLPRSEDAKAPADSGDLDARALVAQAEAAIRASRNFEGLALLDQACARTTQHDRTLARLRMRALINLRRFDEAIDLFESLDARLQNEAAMRGRYVEACANLRDLERARSELRKVMFLDRGKAVANIAALYRFAPLLPPDQRSMMTDLMASAAPEARAQATVIMRCAHDYIQAGDWKGYFNLIGVLDGFDLSSGEHGRMALLRAQLAFRLGDATAMVDQLNAALTLLKASPIRMLEPRRGLTLDNIEGTEAQTRSDGPLVSVMMTSFNSAETIGYAIQSILGQTHANLELLVIDDASTDNSAEIISGYAKRDPRVVPILSSTNAGTYVSKNLALSQARGEFVTCQDSDDWAHPRKLQASVARLSANPRLVATGVQHVRMSPEAGLQFRADYVRPDASSLMYRAQPVRRSIGFYDSVRAGADSEFQRRLELSFGRTAVQYGQELLSLVLWSSGSLSGGGDFAIDDDSGVLPPARNAYRQSFVQWHEQSESHHIDFPLTSRPFEAPASMLPERG